jgi:hypothetical protein
MRLRITVLAAAFAATASLIAPSIVSAAPRHNHHLTIAATPNPIAAGDGVLVYGQLRGSDISGQTITLYQHVIGSGGGYAPAGTTTTNSFGFYEFTEPQGAVVNDTNWFVRGPDSSHSRTVHERVSALVSADASSTSTDTAHPIVFTGTVAPNHAGGRVFLQAQRGSSDDWQTLRSGRLDSHSAYSIPYRWRRPGERDVRVVFRSDARNLRGVSDPITVDVEQAQVPGFTIASSAPITDEGSTVTISGVLDQAGTTTPEPSTVVQLWGRRAHQGHFVVLADGTTGSDGSYSFTQPGLTTNTVYYVATMRLGHAKRRHTALLYQGVRDVLTMQSSTSTATTGQTVTFTGTVMPDKAGHSIYLQRLGRDGDWHNVEVGTVRHDSTFAFAWAAGSPGTDSFRARITSDGANVGSASAPVSITVTAPPVSSLPPAS